MFYTYIFYKINNNFIFFSFIIVYLRCYFFLIEKTPLYHAVEIQNLEIIGLLLSNPTINVNVVCILNHMYL